MLYETFIKQDKYISIKDIKEYTKDNFEDIYDAVRIHNQNFIDKKLIELKDYFDNMYKGIDDNILLDKEQRIAILTDEDYNMIVAGAGSGKTTTMAAKVKYLVEIKKVDPKNIILISYTNKAVNELKERINKQFKINVLVCTFHKFGVDILKANTDEYLKVLLSGYNIINDYFSKILCNDNESLKEFLKFFVFYFDIPAYALKFDSLNDYHNYKKRNDYLTLKSRLNDYNKTVIDTRTNKKYSILGEFLRSSEEVMIANFLYLNNICYDYEKPYPKLDKSKTYLPDFTLYQGENILYLEHFGLNYQGYNKLYSKINNYKYRLQINNKRKLHQNYKTVLLETYSGPDLLNSLEQQLISHGFILKPKSAKEIYSKLVDTSKDIYYTRFIIFCLNFIQGFKIKGYDKNDFAKLKQIYSDERTLLFLNFIEKVYNYYERELEINHYIDFEDMINKAYLKLDKAKLNYEYIIIDEYQDISMQRFNLTKKIADVSKAKVTAVGDDWQAVFAFAGSDVTLFTKFKDLMGYATELQITHTYRNSQELIDVAGKFVMQNNKQIKKQLVSPKHLEKPVMIITYDDTNNKTKNKLDMLNNCLKDIYLKYGSKQKILFIGRFNFEKYYLLESQYFSQLEQDKLVSKNYPTFEITFLSAHSSKGLGYDQVIILNGSDGTYGFPSQIKDDPIMKIVNKEDNSILFSEERRLFYVALTRTKNKVYILTPVNCPSLFLIELKNYSNVTVYNKTGLKFSLKEQLCPICHLPLIRKYGSFKIRNLYVCSNEKELCSFKTNDLKYKLNIRKCPKCDGYLIVKHGKTAFLGCTNYNKGCKYTEKIF
ncbi:MAG: UvrD-helicase domain-containing protein [Bacilli bacterium]